MKRFFKTINDRELASALVASAAVIIIVSIATVVIIAVLTQPN